MHLTSARWLRLHPSEGLDGLDGLRSLVRHNGGLGIRTSNNIMLSGTSPSLHPYM